MKKSEITKKLEDFIEEKKQEKFAPEYPWGEKESAFSDGKEFQHDELLSELLFLIEEIKRK